MGKLIAIDGLDGSGKGTMTQRLYKHLLENKVDVRKISFPMYENKSSYGVKMYLGGELGGNPDDTNGYAASALFAMDRYLSYRTDWGAFVAKEGTVTIADRYTSANAVHQLSKLPREQWDEFLAWLYDYEHVKLGLPVADLTVYLEMPPAISKELIRRRSEQTGRKIDIHEKNAEYMDRCYEAALYAAGKLGWRVIPCFEGDEPRDLDLIFADLLALLNT
ncbi:MAG: thymidylate kinase [Ruminococcaceae bacterium]|nr:thymidylate kinase [Oscillospiraceae bacterium]